MSNAKSLRCVVTELDRNGSKSPQADPLLFSGVFLASPILWSFAIKIELKAWQCREQKKAPDPTHDLLKLFESLEPETRELLEERMRAVEPYSIEPLLEGMRSFEPLRKVLSSHKDTFKEWRYIYEGNYAPKSATHLIAVSVSPSGSVLPSSAPDFRYAGLLVCLTTGLLSPPSQIPRCL